MKRGIIPMEIRDSPAAIRATLREAAQAARDAAAALLERKLHRAFVIGNGTSYHSALAAAALYARLAGPEDPVVLPMTAGDFRTYHPRLGLGDAVIGISASGEFADVVDSMADLRGQVPTVGVVHVPGSSLTTVADHVVLSAGGPSRAAVMTKTFSATLVAAEMTLLALLGDDRAADPLAEIEIAAGHMESAIASAERGASEVAEVLDGHAHLFVVGAGLAHIAALEAALKLKEIALVHAEGGETWEVASGAATMLDDRAVVIALAPIGPGRAATGELVRHASAWGAITIEVGPERFADATTLIELPADAREDHAPLTTVPPIAIIAYALAQAKGIDPDRPDWVSRYHSQGMRHILGVEEMA